MLTTDPESIELDHHPEPGVLRNLLDPVPEPGTTLSPPTYGPAPTPPPASTRHIKLENRGVTPHRAQHELWRPQLHFRDTVAAKLAEAGLVDEANVIQQCHTQVSVAVCVGCSKPRKFLNRCDRSYCPCCQPRLARERRDSVEWWTRQIAQPKHVVLTTTNTSDLTRDHVDRIKQAFTRLRRTKFADGWRGGMWSVEVTNEGRGWHLHLHALIDADWIDARQLSVAWHRATGGAGHIVKVKDTRERSYLQEVTKYAVKGTQLASWSSTEVAEFVTAFARTRTFGVFGSLYKLRALWRAAMAEIQSERPACECGCVDVRILSENEWIAECTLDPPTCARPSPAPKRVVADLPELDLQDYRRPAWA